MKTIGDRIQQIQAETGLNDTTLAEATKRYGKVSQQAINKIRNGKTNDPGVKTLQSISKAAGYSLIWLITGKGNKKSDRDWELGDSDQLAPAQERALLAGIRHILVKRGMDPRSADFQRAALAAFDDAKADLLAAERAAR